MDTWLQLASVVFPDAIKILGSAIVTGTFTYLAMRNQVKAAIETAKEQNDLEARTRMYEHYNNKSVEASKKAEEAINGLSQMMGISAAEELDGSHGRLISKYFDPFFEQTIRQQPFLLKRLRNDVDNYLGQDTSELELIKTAESRFEELSPITDHTSLVDAACALIDSYALTSMCYTLIYEKQATSVLSKYLER